MSNGILTKKYACDECDKSFDSEQGLRMHKIRTHSNKGWDTTGNLSKARRKRMNKMEALERRKRKYREAVERYHSMGLNAHGDPLKGSPQYRTRTERERQIKREANQRMRAKYLAQGLTSRGEPRKRPYSPKPRRPRSPFAPISYSGPTELEETTATKIPRLIAALKETADILEKINELTS